MFSKIKKQLNQRKSNGNYRELKVYPPQYSDFFSNDYLGLAKNNELLSQWVNNISDLETIGNSSARLIAGNNQLFNQVESYLSKFYNSETGLIYPSGFMANIGFFSCVPQKGDTVLYDEQIHASIREGIRLSYAKAYSFKHNNQQDLEKKINLSNGNIFVVIEGIYSMDGDIPSFNFELLNAKYSLQWVIDEAHSTGILGPNKKGFFETIPTQNILARIHTFGKAIGAHGAFIATNELMKNYLINFSKPFIYSTAIPDYQLEHILLNHKYLETHYQKLNQKLKKNIEYFKECFSGQIKSNSPIISFIHPKSKEIEQALFKQEILVKAIMPPTIPKGTERLRISIHNFNTIEEIRKLTKILNRYV